MLKPKDVSMIAQDQANIDTARVRNAIAQAYNHTILPRLHRDDHPGMGITEFNSASVADLGMWLPETA
jgi:hypothetical protein